jgi:hypothetical protein
MLAIPSAALVEAVGSRAAHRSELDLRASGL